MSTIRNLQYSIPHISSGQLLSCNVSESHGSTTAVAVIETTSSGFSLGEHIDISIGDSHNGSQQVFSGYVKSVERNIPDNIYTITANDDLIRAMDYYIVPSDPVKPLLYSNPISDADLIKSLLAISHLTNVDAQTSNFTFGTVNPFQVTQVSVYDFCKSLADLLAFTIWCDRHGQIHFRCRKPYAMINSEPIVGWVADTPTSNYTVNDSNIINISRTTSNTNLRNRVIVYGYGGLHYEATDDSIDDFHWKTAVFGGQDLLDTQQMVTDTANFNLHLLNRLTDTLSVTIVGTSYAQPFQTVTVNSSKMGISNLQYYVYTAEHSLSNAGYIVKLDLRRT